MSLGEPTLKWNQMNEEGVVLLLHGLILGVHDWALTHQVWGLAFTWEMNGRCLWSSCWRRAKSITILAFQACFDIFDYDYKSSIWVSHLKINDNHVLFLKIHIFLFYVYEYFGCNIYVYHGGQKRALNSLELGLDVCKMPYGYRILNQSFPQEQQALLATNQPLQQ